jgi:putative membrane protein
MMFGWIIIIILIILAVWYFNQGNFTWFERKSRQDSPLEELKKRFARGEISKEEYEEQKRLLDKEN